MKYTFLNFLRKDRYFNKIYCDECTLRLICPLEKIVINETCKFTLKQIRKIKKQNIAKDINIIIIK